MSWGGKSSPQTTLVIFLKKIGWLDARERKGTKNGHWFLSVCCWRGRRRSIRVDETAFGAPRYRVVSVQTSTYNYLRSMRGCFSLSNRWYFGCTGNCNSCLLLMASDSTENVLFLETDPKIKSWQWVFSRYPKYSYLQHEAVDLSQNAPQSLIIIIHWIHSW